MWLSISITICGTLIASLIWVLQRKWSKIVRFSLACVIGILLFIAFYLLLDPTFLGEGAWYHSSPYRESIYFILMLSGMAVRYITKAIEDRREKRAKLKEEGAGKEKLKEVQIEFDMWEFSYPFFFSIITFGALLKLIEAEQTTLSNLILSFQTGFFWQTILKKEV